jgi:hypothetical protein
MTRRFPVVGKLTGDGVVVDYHERPRPGGYYWVYFQDGWTVGQWDGDLWAFVGSDYAQSDTELKEKGGRIGPRAEKPAELEGPEA